MSPYAFGFEPLFLALAVAAAVVYWRAARREPPSRWRVVAFAAGLLLIAASLNSPLENLAAHYLLLMHLLQNALIADWGPPLLILGLSPGMRAALCVAFLANLTAFPLTNGLLPYVASEIFRTDQTGLGYLSASFAFGSLMGSISLTLSNGVRIARLMIGATLAWYAMLMVFVEIRSLPVALACLVLAGMAQSLSMISAAVILMRTASERFRGRVMGVRMMVIYGLPLGLLAAGSLIDVIGYSATGMLYAVSGLIAMAAIALHWRDDLWPVHAPANAR